MEINSAPKQTLGSCSRLFSQMAEPMDVSDAGPSKVKEAYELPWVRLFYFTVLQLLFACYMGVPRSKRSN